MKYRRVALIGSSVANLIAVLSLIFRGLNFGVDFEGGVLLEVTYEQPADLASIRDDLDKAGIEDARVQTFGASNDVLIRLPALGDTSDTTGLEARLMDILSANHPDVQKQRLESVGGQVGTELAENGALAMIFALLMIFAYVMLRFRWKLALGAIVATVHDVLITVGVFSLLQWQFDLVVLGSVLAVLGYSLNDTIVVYDRIRDNFRLMRRGSPYSIVDASVNQTLARTLVTGVTSLLVLIALMLLGGDTLWGFSVALIIGIVVGTYSSIYVASAMALALNVTPSDLITEKRKEVDETP
jgi:preprotein translocase subunit SecF